MTPADLRLWRRQRLARNRRFLAIHAAEWLAWHPEWNVVDLSDPTGKRFLFDDWFEWPNYPTSGREAT